MAQLAIMTRRESPLKALFIHAHYDDYEFTAAGTFELWRRKLGDDFRGRVVVCCDGRAGHHFRTRDETARIRLAEQEASARLGGYEFVPLLLPDGTMPREACLQVTPELLAALWKAIRDFEPDYLFCPPLGSDPLAGIHNDHETVAEAVRRVAYMINVPHAFTPAAVGRPSPDGGAGVAGGVGNHDARPLRPKEPRAGSRDGPRRGSLPRHRLGRGADFGGAAAGLPAFAAGGGGFGTAGAAASAVERGSVRASEGWRFILCVGVVPVGFCRPL